MSIRKKTQDSEFTSFRVSNGANVFFRVFCRGREKGVGKKESVGKEREETIDLIPESEGEHHETSRRHTTAGELILGCPGDFRGSISLTFDAVRSFILGLVLV